MHSCGETAIQENLLDALTLTVHRQFLFRPVRYPGESWQGHLMRWVENNALRNTRHLAQILGVKTCVLQQDYGQTYLQASMRQDQLTAEPAVSSRLQLSKHRSAYHRYCPACLVQAPFIRAKWEWPMYFCCTEHQARLESVCAGCNAVCTYTRKRLLFCDCGLDLRTVAAKPENTVLTLVQSIFYGDSEFASHQFNPVPLLQRRALSTVDALMPSAGAWIHKLSTGVTNPHDEGSALAVLESAFSGFPESLDPYLESYVQASPKRHIWLTLRRFNIAELPQWRNLLQDFIKRRVMGPQWHSSPLAEESRRLYRRTINGYSISSLARATGVREKIVRALIENGKLEYCLLRDGTGPGKRRYVIPFEDAETFKSFAAATTSMEELASLLGVSNEVAYALYRCGFIPGIALSKTCMSYVRFKPQDVLKRVESLYAGAEELPAGQEQGLWRLQFTGTSTGSVARAQIARMLKYSTDGIGKVYKPAGPTQRLGDLLFAPSQLPSTLGVAHCGNRSAKWPRSKRTRP